MNDRHRIDEQLAAAKEQLVPPTASLQAAVAALGAIPQDM